MVAWTHPVHQRPARNDAQGSKTKRNAPSVWPVAKMIRDLPLARNVVNVHPKGFLLVASRLAEKKVNAVTRPMLFWMPVSPAVAAAANHHPVKIAAPCVHRPSCRAARKPVWIQNAVPK